MAEEYALTDPVVVPEKVTNKLKVSRMVFDMDSTALSTPDNPTPAKGIVEIVLKDNQGNLLPVPGYQGQQAIDLMRWLNTANFSTTSMQKRVLNKLEKDGQLPPGDVTGTPDPPVIPPVNVE